jgi:hypothetical protein
MAQVLVELEDRWWCDGGSRVRYKGMLSQGPQSYTCGNSTVYNSRDKGGVVGLAEFDRRQPLVGGTI